MSKKDVSINKLLSIKEAADLIGTHISNIYVWIDNKKLSVVNRGNHKLVFKKECLKIKRMREKKNGK
jgi:excisionase family DNA binding protein